MEVSFFSQRSSKLSGATGSKSAVYCLIPTVEAVKQHLHMQEWYRNLPSSRYGCAKASTTVILLSYKSTHTHSWYSRNTHIKERQNEHIHRCLSWITFNLFSVHLYKNWNVTNTRKVLAGMPERMRIERPKQRWESDIKKDLKE
jgi:hypothetical protein